MTIHVEAQSPVSSTSSGVRKKTGDHTTTKHLIPRAMVQEDDSSKTQSSASAVGSSSSSSSPSSTPRKDLANKASSAVQKSGEVKDDCSSANPIPHNGGLGTKQDRVEDAPILGAKTGEDPADDATSSPVSTVGGLMDSTSTQVPPVSPPSEIEAFDIHSAASCTADRFGMNASCPEDDLTSSKERGEDESTTWGEWNDRFPASSKGRETAHVFGAEMTNMTDDSLRHISPVSFTGRLKVSRIKRLPTAQEVDGLDSQIKDANKTVLRHREQLAKSEAQLRELIEKRDRMYRGEIVEEDPTDSDDEDSNDASPQAFIMHEEAEEEENPLHQTLDASYERTHRETIKLCDDHGYEESLDSSPHCMDDVIDSMGIAKCGICGKRLPLDVEAMEAHILLCEESEETAEHIKSAHRTEEAAEHIKSAHRDFRSMPMVNLQDIPHPCIEVVEASPRHTEPAPAAKGAQKEKSKPLLAKMRASWYSNFTKKKSNK